MSTVKIEPFIFGSEDEGFQVQPENLPGAIKESAETPEKEDKKEESKPAKVTDKEEKSKSVAIEKTEEPEEQEEAEDDDSNHDPLGLFGKAAKEDKNNDKEEEEKLSSDKIDYKAFTDFLVDSEVWRDFEGREDLEYNEETFKALWKVQAENTAREFISQEREQLGLPANQLLEYLKNGGTVDDFVDNYTQQLDVASMDTSDEGGQEKAIKEYYKSLDWSDSKIKKHIERLKDSGESEFKEEAEDCRNKLIEAIEAEREEMIREQEAIAQDRKLRIEAFNKAVRNEIYKDSNLADREKKELDKFIYEYKYQDDQGNRYSEFMVKFNEINKDPKKYQKFLKFVKNIDTFEDASVAEKKAVSKTFNFLKQGGNPLEGAQSKEPVKQKANNIPPGFKFK